MYVKNLYYQVKKTKLIVEKYASSQSRVSERL